MKTGPNSYPRRVLLAVAGLSPQIVTETLYALAGDAASAFIPTEVRLVTTSEGAHRAQLSLLSDDPGWFQRLLGDYRLPNIVFGAQQIEIVRDAQGQLLADIRSAADNERVADHITETIRALTADPLCALHVSIAGGRKTMGYYAGYALSLFGRPQDRLSHVLVSEPFEQSWEFFYPTPYSRVITTRDNKLADTKDAQVTLASVPFVRLRDDIPERLLAGQASFGETIKAAQRATEPPKLVIDLEHKRISAGGQAFTLGASSLAFYAAYAQRRLNGQGPARYDTEGFVEQYLDQLRRISGPDSGLVENAEKKLAKGMDDGLFTSRKSRTNVPIEKALGSRLACAYLIEDDGGRPESRFLLKLPPEAIRFGSVVSEPVTLQANAEADDA